MNVRPLLAAAALAGLLAPAALHAAPKTYTIDTAHSTAGFRIRHLMSKVDGRFRDVSGRVVYDPQAPASSSVEVTVQAASIDTAHANRDEHLRSADFFDVARFPTLTFRSVAVEPVSATRLNVTGDLTIHGKTQRVTVPVEVLGTMPFRGGEKAGFETSFTIDRKAYDIVWNRALDQGGALLGDDVEVTIRLEADWKPEQPAATSGR